MWWSSSTRTGLRSRLVCGLIAFCTPGEASRGQETESEIAQREVLAWVLNETPRWEPSPQVPLAGRVTSATSLPAVVSIEVRGDDGHWTIPLREPPRTEHSLPVLGLKPDRVYELIVTARTEFATLTADPLTIRTPELPVDFPGFSLVSADHTRMEPGITLCSILRWEENTASLDEAWFVAFDAAGDVVWYLRLHEPGGAIQPLPQGGFAFLHGVRPTGLREIDPLGVTLRQFRATGLGLRPQEDEIAIEAETLHHDLCPLPNGHLLALSTEVRTIDNFPASESNPQQTAPANVVGDVILELSPAGHVVRRWPLLDILDPKRIGYGSLDSFWDLRAYPFHFGGTKDWSHCNAVVYDETDDAIIVCLRHQDAVVKFDRSTSAVQWILGDRGGWRGELSKRVLQPEGPLQWPFHAHGVKFRPEDGALLLFDNGNCRALPPNRAQPATTSYSRAVEYQIDEDQGKVREVWKHGSRGKDRYFSAFVGDADWLPQTGNVLITDGGRLETRTGAAVGFPPGDIQWGRVLEVTRDNPAEVVWELHVSEQGRRNRSGSSIYRAERLRGLYW